MEEVARRFQHEHGDYNAIMVKALGDGLSEAFAELITSRMPVARERDHGFGQEGKGDLEDTLRW